MEYGRIQHVDRPISRIVFGTATPALFDATRSAHGGEPGFEDKLQTAFALLDGMYALGVNAFDCAHHYGEEPLGEWMESRGVGDKCVVLTKGAHHNAWRKRVTDYDILSDAHDSLAKLKTEHIAIYLLHRDDPDQPVGPIVEALNRLHDEGKIGAFGGSNWAVERIEQANEYALTHGLVPFCASSPNFSLADQLGDPWGGGCVSLSGPANRAAREWYAANAMPVFAYSSLARGLFSGAFQSDDPDAAARVLDEAGRKGYLYPENLERLRRCELLSAHKGVSVAQLALSWVFNQRDLDVFALTSPVSEAMMRQNMEAAALRLSDAECRWLDLLSDSGPAEIGC